MDYRNYHAPFKILAYLLYNQDALSSGIQERREDGTVLLYTAKLANQLGMRPSRLLEYMRQLQSFQLLGPIERLRQGIYIVTLIAPARMGLCY